MYSFSGKLRYSECDAEGRMTFLSMINYLQDGSTFQCEELGIGVEFMRMRNKAWFLAAWNIFVPELPVFGAVLVISTWPYQFKGIYGMNGFPTMELWSKLTSVLDDGYTIALKHGKKMPLENVRRKLF